MDKAYLELQRAYQLQPGFRIADLVFGDYYMQTQQYDSAAYYLKRADLYGKSRLAAVYFAQGMQEKAWDIVKEMETNITPYYAFTLAVLYAQLGDTEKFFEYANYPKPHAFQPWLRKAVSNPDITTDTRFNDLMIKMNLPMPLAQ
jgi:tetratricopeptide (TPR) repeat protein